MHCHLECKHMAFRVVKHTLITILSCCYIMRNRGCTPLIMDMISFKETKLIKTNITKEELRAFNSQNEAGNHSANIIKTFNYHTIVQKFLLINHKFGRIICFIFIS